MQGDIFWYRGDPPAYHDGAWELNVKRHDLARGPQWGGPAIPDGATDADGEAAWDDLTREWWEETMPTLVREAGFDPANIYADGRSGGWLVHAKRGVFAYIEDYGSVDDLDPSPDTAEDDEDRAILAERFLNLRERVEELCAALIDSLPTADDLMARVRDYRDARTEAMMAQGTVCPSCGAIIKAAPMMVAAR